MPIPRLYELENANGDCTSPFVWRIKFALQRKGIAYEPVAVGFLDIPKIGPGTLKTVPVLEHDGHFISESWSIAEWLHREFAQSPSLFSSPAEKSMIRFFDKWFGTQVLPPMFRSCVIDIFNHVKPEEQDYFRSSRERGFGQSLEAVASQADDELAQMRSALLPMRLALTREPFLGGWEPNYADFIAWGAFVGFSPIATKPLLASDDPLAGWLCRGLILANAARRTGTLNATQMRTLLRAARH